MGSLNRATWTVHSIYAPDQPERIQMYHCNSILLHSGLNLAWHFWLSTRFSNCLKNKWEHFRVYSRTILQIFDSCKPRDNLWNCSKKIHLSKIFETDSFLGNKKMSLIQNVWRDHPTMQQDVLMHFLVIFPYWNQAEIWKKYSVVHLYI